MSASPGHSGINLADLGLDNAPAIHRNGSSVFLYEQAIKRGEAEIAAGGPLLANTGKHTGRSPNDKFTVREPGSENNVAWGAVNKDISEAQFDALLGKVTTFLADQELFVQEVFAGADPDNRVGVRVITQRAWCGLFVRHMFLDEVDTSAPVSTIGNFTVVHAPDFHADPAVDGTHSDAFILLHISRGLVLIGGTKYAGEIKKSIFTAMNYILPTRDVFPMHCSANHGEPDDVALFFGLSGTGKTTLSADSSRVLVGDDEHGWSDNGVFNMEGGCYAKAINLSAEAEPEIYATTSRFGTILENVVYDPDSRTLDFDDDTLTENTRVAYPISFIDNSSDSGQAGHASNIMLLTADAFGVLPPISRLDDQQAMYYFLAGYTARLAGTEVGVTEPQATFSACFGAPFLPRDPGEYADLLGERLRRHRPDVWLVNTGWTGGRPGVGHRMPIAQTRAMVRAALDGTLVKSEFATDPSFGLQIPVACPGVDSKLLSPRATWDDKAAYDSSASQLITAFRDNFDKTMRGSRPELAAAGPGAS
ncbi:MAG TPA: phosphoenolpyruvate carboxykinase (ATP) [Chloroflexota bacterium]|nr:phosphoenolpyruvate carboxykinase (ATP) [Chloroflexota bacterium]